MSWCGQLDGKEKAVGQDCVAKCGIGVAGLEGDGVWSEVGEMERWNTGTGVGMQNVKLRSVRCGVSHADGFGVRQWDLRAATVAVTNSGVQWQEVWEPLCSIVNKKWAFITFQRVLPKDTQRTLVSPGNDWSLGH